MMLVVAVVVAAIPGGHSKIGPNIVTKNSKMFFVLTVGPAI